MVKLQYSQTEIDDVVNNLLEYINKIKIDNQATVLALSGNLGAGKTTLVQALATALGVKEKITSPTFVVMKRYQTDNSVFKELIHIDAYRIEQDEEMVVLGFEKWLKNPQALICIEWPEKIVSLVPPSAIAVSLEVVDENTRKIIYG